MSRIYPVTPGRQPNDNYQIKMCAKCFTRSVASVTTEIHIQSVRSQVCVWSGKENKKNCESSDCSAPYWARVP
jgi:hypothetical protein